MKAWVLILLQLLSTLGFGVNAIIALIMAKVPDGPRVISELMETPHPPIVSTIFFAVLCFLGTVSITIHNMHHLEVIGKETKSDG